MLSHPGRFTDRDLFTFRQARVRAGAKPATINRDMRTLRAMLKGARPDFRFPGAAFFPEDETRVRWLRPEEELLVLEPMPAPFGKWRSWRPSRSCARERSGCSAVSTSTSSKAS
jgi:hypothetical protein